MNFTGKPSTVNLAVRQRLEGIAPRVSNVALQQGVVLLAANSLGNVLQYAFHFFASRMLGPTEYGVFVSLLGVSMILTVPTAIAQTVITQYVSGFYARKEMTRASALIRRATKELSLASGVVFGLTCLASPVLAVFLNIPSAWPIVAMGSVFLLTGPFTTITSALQGLQRFYAVAAQSVLGPGFRLGVGVVLMLAGMGASGALSATTISNLLIVGVFIFPLRHLFSGPVEEHGLTWGALSRSAGLVFVGTLAFTVLTNMDVVLVKHFFSATEAGFYSSASVLGKVILFFPGAVSTMMFPKSSYRYALGQSATDLARKSVLVSLVLCGGAAAALAIFPAVAVQVVFGDQFEASVSLVGPYGLAMGVCALVQLLLFFYISQQQARFAWLMVAVTGALAVFLVLVHVSMIQVILSLAAGASIILIVGEFWLDGLGLVQSCRSLLK